MRVVIVGNGVAGIEAARAIRARDRASTITIVSDESRHFFARTALLYVLAGQQSMREIEPIERAHVDALGLEVVRGRAVGVDTGARTLRLDDGRALSYDALLVASGSRPRPLGIPGEDTIGVGTFVTLRDLAWLHEELHGVPLADVDASAASAQATTAYTKRPSAWSRKGRAADRVVVVGGGLIGIECVEAALAAKKDTHFVVRDEWVWPMAIDAREGAFIGRALSAHGCHVHARAEVRSIGAVEGVVDSVTLSVGGEQKTIGCDALVVAIGVEPNTEWLAGSPIERDARGGIVVDDRLATSIPGVFAAGDCASVPAPGGGHTVQQLWYTARDQGRVVGRAITGDADARHTMGVFYNSAKLMDVEYTTVGRIGRSAPSSSEWFFEETGKVQSTVRIAHEAGAVVGVNVLGRRVDHTVLARFIEERRSPRDVVRRLGEARFDTEFVPPLVVPKSAWPAESAT